METTTHSRKSVDELFEAVLARPPEERSAFLDSACPEAPQVRKLVEILLRADAQAGSFLEPPLPFPSDIQAPKPCATFEPGCVICSRFHIHRFIARGGMGEVYEAWDSELSERVAIKTIRPELAQRSEVLDRFRREVKQARAISHPNICRIHELFCHGEDSGTRVWFLSMEFLDGFTLSEHITHLGPVKPPLALNLVEQIISGLTAAHSMGVIHRDLKSGNIMLTSGVTGSLRAVITDFGLALNVFHRDVSLSEPGGQGTPEYMPPEQRETGEVSALADEYALGVIMCEMLMGSRPTRKDVTTGRAQLQSTLTRHAGIRWSRVILRCLEQEPQNRFNKLSDVVPALKPADRSSRTWRWAALAALVAFLVAFGLWHRVRPAPPATSLAVLPLENHTGDSNLDYVGAGITEALTDDLARMPGLQVAAGSVARRFQGPRVDPTSAGKQMHVGTVLSGSIENSSGKLTVPIEVIDVSSGHELWGQTYETKSSDFVDLQHRISTDVAYHLRTHVDPNMTERLKRQYSTNPAAYNSYLKGRFQLAKRSPEALREALAEFQHALNSDPNYAPAYAGLADCYSLLALYSLEKPKPILEQAVQASQRALELDSTLGEAYTSRALARTMLDFDWKGAEDDYKRAIEINPSYIQAHTWYGLRLLSPEGRMVEARAQMTYVQNADPGSLASIVGVAYMEQLSGHYDTSIRMLEPHARGPHPFEPAIEILATDYLAKQDSKKAIKLLTQPPGDTDAAYFREALLGAAYAKVGQKARAIDCLDKTIALSNQGHPISYGTAVIYTALGDHAKALDMLRTALDDRESNIVFLNVDPLLADLRAEPGFRTLSKDVNLN